MPKWQVGEELSLKEILIGLGMTSAFDPTQADFSPMLGASGAGFALDFAKHKAWVSVDEQGTEAAAATATGGADAYSAFIVDHPFVYLIRDRLTGTILFLGRVVDPRDHGSF